MLLVATAMAVLLLAGCGSSQKEGCADSGSTVGQQEETSRSEVSNGKIAFQRRAPSGAGDIYVTDADGTNETRLVNDSAQRDGPVWSPDGEKIAFRGLDSVSHGNESALYVTDEDGTDEEHLTSSMLDERIVHGHPTWSPDGTKIAFSRYVEVRQRNPSTDPASASPGNVGPARVSVPVAERTGDYMINVDGNGLCKLASTELKGRGGDAHVWSPAWSPDGEKIAFYDYDAFNVINADGTGRKELTKTVRAQPPERDAGLAQHVWSPDGTKIAFISESLGRSHLYVMDADVTNRTRLAIDVGEFVSWGSGLERCAPWSRPY
jgi:Tol biopolymer transport system component